MMTNNLLTCSKCGSSKIAQQAFARFCETKDPETRPEMAEGWFYRLICADCGKNMWPDHRFDKEKS